MIRYVFNPFTGNFDAINLADPGTLVGNRALFTFQSGRMPLRQVFVGEAIENARIVIQTPFDDPRATLEVGTTETPGLLFGVPDVSLQTPGQYISQAEFEFGSGDYLMLIVNPGLSTQGSGVVLYDYRGAL